MNKVYLEDLVNQLNYNWFLSKKEFFQKETFYNKELEIIKDTFDNPYSDGFETNSNNKLIEISVDLNSYCWSSYFYGSRVQAFDDEQRLYYGIPIDASDISSDIVDYISFTTSKYTEILAIHKFILGVIDIINDCINALCNNLSDSDDDYSNCLLCFQSKTRREIGRKFGHIAQQISFLESSDYLEFNLTQDQLAAILLILNKSGFINSSDINDTRFLHFCAAHFKFKLSGKYKTPTGFKALSQKYNAIKNGDNTTVLPTLVALIKDTLKGL